MTKARKALLRKLPEYNAGKRFAFRCHVSMSNLQICKYAWTRIAKKARRKITRAHRDPLHALFLGALEGHNDNRQLYKRVMQG